MFLVLSYNCLCPIHWSQVLRREWRWDVVGAAPTGDTPTTFEWSTMLLPTKVRIILEVWRYVLSNVSVSISKQLPQMNYYPHTHIIDPNVHNIRITYVCLNQDEMSRLLFLDSKFFTETFIIWKPLSCGIILRGFVIDTLTLIHRQLFRAKLATICYLNQGNIIV